MTIELSPDQREAIDRVTAWWRGDLDSQWFSLAGHAGTGKTTIIFHLLKHLGSRVVVAAPTGKAALRLREKGVDASTIHQLAYHYAGIDEAGDMLFDFAGIKHQPTLVIIDEASMINQAVFDDLRGEGYRMLFVGDHGQLAPVGGDPGLMREPDFTLSVIHRQDDEGLLDFAHALRQGEWLPDARGAVEKRWLDPRGHDAVLDDALRADVMLCWRNQTRHWLNRIALSKYFRIEADDNVPAVLTDLRGEVVRAVCLRNDYKRGVFNGLVVDLRIGELHGDSLLHAEIVIDSKKYGEKSRPVLVDTRGFFLDQRGYQPPQGHLLFDFGYCLTVHKAQGSEWPHVAVYDDTYRGFEDRARFCYTAATRAKKRLTWMHR